MSPGKDGLFCLSPVYWAKSIHQSYLEKVEGIFMKSLIMTPWGFFKKVFIYLLDREREREQAQAGGATEGETDSLLSGSQTWGSIPGCWDHDLSQRWVLN